MQDAMFTRERVLKSLVFQFVLCATIIFGGMTVLWLTPGPDAVAIVALLAYAAVIGIPAYFVARHWIEGKER